MKYLVTNPLNYLFAFIILSVLMVLLTKRRKLWRFSLVPVGIILLYLLSPLGANQTISFITAKDDTTQCHSQAGLVFFGSDGASPSGPKDFSSVNGEEAKALMHAIQWTQENLNRKLILAGPKGSNTHYTKPKIAAELSKMIGLSESSIVLVESEGALLQYALAASQLITQPSVTLFSSDIKSSRQKYAIENAGKSACLTISSNNEISAHSLRMLIPSPESISLLEKTLWEMFGLLWYKIN